MYEGICACTHVCIHLCMYVCMYEYVCMCRLSLCACVYVRGFAAPLAPLKALCMCVGLLILEETSVKLIEVDRVQCLVRDSRKRPFPSGLKHWHWVQSFWSFADWD